MDASASKSTKTRSGSKTSHETKIGLWTIWAMGVGSALGGDFFGWQFVLFGGFFSALAAILFSAVFYWLYASAITELAVRYKTTGGAFDFVNFALGRRPGSIMAIVNLLKLLLANSATALAISSYLVQAGLPQQLKFLSWIATYGFFTTLDCIGIRESSKVQICATILCVLILLFYSFSNFSYFGVNNLISRDKHHLPGFEGFLQGLPFALSFFDGFEEIPLLISYAVDPDVTIPRAVTICYVTVTCIGLLVFISGSGAVSETVLLNADAPLMVGIQLVYGVGSFVSVAIAYMIVLGLVVNFFAFIVFTSQQVQTIAQAGFAPEWLAYRHPKHGAPIPASIVSSLGGICITATLSSVISADIAQNTLLAASLMPAIVGYILLFQCIIKIRSTEAKYVDPAKIPTARQAEILGVDPKGLRFKYGHYGIRLAQAMCLVMLVGLIVLCSSSLDYMYGMFLTGILGVIAYVVMIESASFLLATTNMFGNKSCLGFCTVLTCCKCSSAFSFIGFLFLAIVSYLLVQQPIYTKGVKNPTEASKGCYHGAVMYAVLLIFTSTYWVLNHLSKRAATIIARQRSEYEKLEIDDDTQ